MPANTAAADRVPGDDAESRAGGRAWLPFLFVALSLLALVAVPLIVERRVDAIRQERAGIVEPAGDAVDEMEIAIAVQASALRAYLLEEPEPAELERYRSARRVEESERGRLSVLAPRIGAEAADRFAEVDALAESRHTVHDRLLGGEIPRELYLDELRGTYEDVFAAASALEATIAQRETEMRTQIQALERQGLIVTALLAGLALLAAYVVFRLNLHSQRRAREEKQLRDSALALTSATETGEVLGRIAESAVQRSHGDSAYVERIDTDLHEVEIVATAGDGTPPVGTRVKYPGSLTEEVLERGAPEIVTDLTAEDRPIARVLREACGRCSALVVPLLAERQAHGALVILRSADKPFRGRDVRQPRVLSVLAALALRRAFLTDQARQRAAEEQALRQAAEAITASFTIEEANRAIAASAIRATTADGAFVERIDAQGREVEVVATAGDFTPAPGERIPFEGCLAEAVVEREEPIRLPRLADSEWPLPGELQKRRSECSAVALPLVDAGAAIGALVLLRAPERMPFDEDDVARAHTFSQLAALAFRKIHLLDDAERRREELQRLMASRERLIRGFSHDVKNPLGAADGHLALLTEGVINDISPEQKESLERSRRSIRSALGLIDDLTELARAEAGRIEVERHAVDVREAAREVADEHRARAEAKGLYVTLGLPDELPLIETDSSRVRQVLGNLVSNAVKYTEQGGIAVRVDSAPRTQEPEPGRWIRVHVIDTGPGIAEEELPLLFEEFMRLDTGAEHGAGIGLAISRRVAQALGGEITVDSEPGRGSTFTLWLPLRKVSRANPPAAAD